MIKNQTPKALREVWEWKSACDREVSHLGIRDALKKRLSNANRNAAKLGFIFTQDKPAKTFIVAEKTSSYCNKRKKSPC